MLQVHHAASSLGCCGLTFPFYLGGSAAQTIDQQNELLCVVLQLLGACRDEWKTVGVWKGVMLSV